ncbi:MAG TPA: T9SS type A sorting domain-containing protein [Bacteroidia bacterium]|nr:T9SS type A sorting domain-containing protein [Bacteroidia bacterium]
MFSISPNPSNGSFQIEFSENFNTPIQFEIFSTQGQKVFSTLITMTGTRKKINLENLSEGIYFYSVSEKGIKSKSGKLIIKK